MNHHQEAWEHVKPHLFGKVTEVALRVPWGFKEDMPEISNITVDEFLNSKYRSDTIILHILSGEGGSPILIKRLIEKAFDRCVKLIVLEHNPDSDEWNIPSIDYIRDMLPNHIEDNWGRNLLLACTTTAPLSLPYLSDDYVKEHLDKTWVEPHDEGIDKEHLIYTHTSEAPYTGEIPDGIVNWVIGGGLAYETMKEENVNILFDSVLRQVLYCAYLYGVDTWKLKKIWNDVDKIIPTKDYKQWRVVTPNGVSPDKIEHMDIKDFMTTGTTVYVSTVAPEHWQHLAEKNNILDAFTERDVVNLKQHG